jgi:3-oxoacyl-[acyl-carrier protein] reductase
MKEESTASFIGKVGIVTGAGQGIGYEIARQLCKAGAYVVLNDLSTSLAESAAASIVAEGGHCMAYAGDVSSPSVIDGLIQTAVSRYGQLDMAVANAGITLFGDFLNYDAKDLQSVLQLNLIGTFLFVQSASRQMVKQGNGGRIVLMSSVTGHQAHKGLAAYGMTKAALEMLARSLVLELSPYQITVNTIAPGATLTERTLSDPTYVDTWSALTPTGRPGTPSDVANATLFFLSPATGHITGQNLIVDGGWTAVSPNPPQ